MIFVFASSLYNFAAAYMQMSMLILADQAHLQAITIEGVSRVDRVGNFYSNMASLPPKMGQADEAEQMLMQCSTQNIGRNLSNIVQEPLGRGLYWVKAPIISHLWRTISISYVFGYCAEVAPISESERTEDDSG